MSETDLWYGTLTATVRVEDLPAARRVVAIELPPNGEWRVCGAGVSDSEGIAVLPISGLPASRIYAVAIDEWGRPFVPKMTVNYGDVIRPSQFVGWMYQVTQPGVLPDTEPDWWNSRPGIPQSVGTALMQAARHYQPITHGPVSDIEWAERERDPYWEDVIFYAPFTDDMLDYSPRQLPTTVVGSCFIDSNDGAAGRGCLVAPGLSYVTAAIDGKFGERDFTIECFVKSASSTPTYGGLVSFEGRLNSDWALSTLTYSGTAASQGSLWVSTSGSGWTTISGASPNFAPLNDGAWHHFALARQGSRLRAFLDGHVKHDIQITGALVQRGAMSCFGKKLDDLMGGNTVRVQHARVTDNAARYIEPFTPSAVPFSIG